MSKETIIIGSRLPFGWRIEDPDTKARVELAGLNSSKIIGATHAETHVPEAFWSKWKSKMENCAPLKSGAVFEARTSDEAAGKAADLNKTEKTGLEPMPKENAGVTPADKD